MNFSSKADILPACLDSAGALEWIGIDTQSQLNGDMEMHDLIPLNLLQRGSRAQVAEVFGSVDQVQRMRELGLSQGAELEMVEPGSPCIVRFRGNKLCIRAADVLRVLMRAGVAS